MAGIKLGLVDHLILGLYFAFVLGIGLYGLTYIYPVYLAVVRGYSSLMIGKTMFVTGLCMFFSAPLAGRLMIYDALEMTYHSVRVQKDPDCAVCGKNPTVTELIDYEEFCGAVSEEAAEAVMGSTISAKDLAAMLDAGDNIFLVDVREPNEYEIVSIPGATLIPKGEFVSGAALERLPQDKRIVLHCKSGARSAEALAIVKNAGFTDAVHVGGGVLAWINQVDPSLPSY